MGLLDWFSSKKNTKEREEENDNDSDVDSEDIADHLREYKSNCSRRRKLHQRGTEVAKTIVSSTGVSFDDYIKISVRISDEDINSVYKEFGLTNETFMDMMKEMGNKMGAGGEALSEYYSYESQLFRIKIAKSKFVEFALLAQKNLLSGEVLSGVPPVSIEEYGKIVSGFAESGKYSTADVLCLETYWETRTQHDAVLEMKLIKLRDE